MSGDWSETQRRKPSPCQGEGRGFESRLPLHRGRSGGLISSLVRNVRTETERDNTYTYRNAFIPAIDTNGISLTAADAALPRTLGANLAHGTFINAAMAHYAAVVLGAQAASLLGSDDLANPPQVWIGGHWFTVVGIMKPVQLVSQMDAMAFIGFPIANQYFSFEGHPSELPSS